MTEQIGGAEAAPVVPTRAASVAEAVARAGERPLLLEAIVDGVALQARRVGDEVTVVGDADAAARRAVEEAVATIEAKAVTVDVVVGADGVRFTDLVSLDGASWVGRPAAERLAELAEVSPVAYMVERMAVAVPSWAGSFVEHVRERGARGIWLRLADAARADEHAWQVVEF